MRSAATTRAEYSHVHLRIFSQVRKQVEEAAKDDELR